MLPELQPGLTRNMHKWIIKASAGVCFLRSLQLGLQLSGQNNRYNTEGHVAVNLTEWTIHHKCFTIQQLLFSVIAEQAYWIAEWSKLTKSVGELGDTSRGCFILTPDDLCGLDLLGSYTMACHSGCAPPADHHKHYLLPKRRLCQQTSQAN